MDIPLTLVIATRNPGKTREIREILKDFPIAVKNLDDFGPLPEDLRHRIKACAKVNAALIAQSRPGSNLGDVLNEGKQAYAGAGFPAQGTENAPL